MRGYGYGSYRGRNRVRTFLLILIAALCLVLVLAVVGFFLLEPYIIYTSDGIRLEFPAGGGREPDQAIVVEPEATPPLLVVTPEPTPEPAAADFRAVLLPRTALTDGTAAAQMEAAGATAAVFDMKADDGTLGYISDLALAKRAEASAADPGLNEAIRALNSGEIYTVARVSCFRDNKLPYHYNAAALRTGAGNWRDSAGIRWLSPAVADSRQYVAGICAELAALGFDEIVLDYAAFPTAEQGRLSSLIVGERYPSGAFDTAIDTFYGEVKAALAPYPDTTLSILTTEAVLDGDPGNLSGQTAALLAAHAGRVWAPAPVRSISDYGASLEQAGMEDARNRLVLVAEALPAEAGGSWAVLDSGAA